MKEYKIFYIRSTAEDTEDKLNTLAREGWVVICSYAFRDEYLIMERTKQ